MRKILIVALFLVAMLLASGTVQAEPPLDVTTDKEYYDLDETVTVYLENNWSDYITTRFGFWISDCDNNPVYDPYWALKWIAVPPGGALDYTWDQTYANSELGEYGAPVPAGCYVAHDLDGPMGGPKTATFYIVE